MEHNSSSGNDGLQLDRNSNVIGINPCLFATADEEFLIFSPIKGQYLFMSKDPAFTDKMHTKVEVRESRESFRNFFKLKKVDGKDCYYLYNVHTEKYVYVSGDGVHGVHGVPEDHDDVSRFEITFEPVGNTGCYKIKNNLNCFFVSSSSAGIPPNFVVHANADKHDDQTDVFQFVLQKKAKEAKIEYQLEKIETVATLLEDTEKEFKNESVDEEKPEEFSFQKEYPKEEGFQFDGFTYAGDYLGGYPAKSADTGDFIITSSSFPNSTAPSDETHKVNSSSKFKISPGKTAVYSYKLEQIFYRCPCTIQVTTRNKKVLETTGLWKGSSYMNGSSRLSQIPENE